MTPLSKISPGDHIQEKVGRTPARACRGSLCLREGQARPASFRGHSLRKVKAATSLRLAALSRPAGWTRSPGVSRYSLRRPPALDPGLPPRLSRP